MKRILSSLLPGVLFLFACSKEKTEPSPLPQAMAAACLPQMENPGGRSYSSDSVVRAPCTDNHCGILPMSGRNYWIYSDSVYNNGVFVKVKYDTLRYVFSWKSLPDGLIWWQGNVQVGLPERLYANDSSIFELAPRLFMPIITDVKKGFSQFEGDSLKYLTSFDDLAAIGRSVKLTIPVMTPAGTFGDCILFDKYSYNYRRDEVYFKPFVGVVKYIRQQAPIGSFGIKLQQVSTLIAYHIE